MKNFILAALLLTGCVNYDGLGERNYIKATVNGPQDAVPIDTATPDSTPDVCQVKEIGLSNNCMIDIPSPGITEDMYLFIGGYTDGIKGPTGHYRWYRVEGKETIVFINCRYGIDKYHVSVSYGCVP